MKRLLALIIPLCLAGCLPSYTGPTSGPSVVVSGDSLVAQSGDELTADFNNAGDRIWVNGVPGATTASLLSSVQTTVNEMHPDLLVIALGINDCRTWDTPPNWTTDDDANMRTMIAATSGQRTVWVVPEYCAANVVGLLDGTGIQPARWDQVIVQHPDWHIWDGIHYNAIGQQGYADFILQAAG